MFFHPHPFSPPYPAYKDCEGLSALYVFSHFRACSTLQPGRMVGLVPPASILYRRFVQSTPGIPLVTSTPFEPKNVMLPLPVLIVLRIFSPLVIFPPSPFPSSHQDALRYRELSPPRCFWFPTMQGMPIFFSSEAFFPPPTFSPSGAIVTLFLQERMFFPFRSASPATFSLVEFSRGTLQLSFPSLRQGDVGERSVNPLSSARPAPWKIAESLYNFDEFQCVPPPQT